MKTINITCSINITNSVTDAAIIADSVVQESPKRVKIYIDVEEGNKYYYNDITWVGNTVVDADKLSRLLNIKKGDVYNKSYFDKRLNSDEDAVANYFYLEQRLPVFPGDAGRDCCGERFDQCRDSYGGRTTGDDRSGNYQRKRSYSRACNPA